MREEEFYRFARVEVLYRIEGVAYSTVLAVLIPFQFIKACFTTALSTASFNTIRHVQPCISLRNAKKDFQFLALMIDSFSDIIGKTFKDPQVFHDEQSCTFDEWVRGLTYWSCHRPYEVRSLTIYA